MNTETGVTDALRLSAWLSPAFPTGAFAWSGGLEAAYAAGHVDGLRDWIEDALSHGAIRTDAILCAAAMRGEDVGDLALALISAPERREEVLAQGEAFALAAGAWIGTDDEPAPIPIAVGRAARAAGLDAGTTLAVFVQSQVTNVIQAAQRLGRIGQNEGVAILVALEPLVLETARFALASTPDDIGTCTLIAEIAALNHGELPSRIFRS